MSQCPFSDIFLSFIERATFFCRKKIFQRHFFVVNTKIIFTFCSFSLLFLNFYFKFVSILLILLTMDKGGCIITYPVKGYGKNILKSAIRLGVNKVILMDESESYTNLFNKLGLITDVRPILTDDVSLVLSSVANLISDAKNDHDNVSVLLLPSDPLITTGVYIASCMEKVKVLTIVSDFEMKCLTLPLFPFVNLNENERFILIKIIENKEVSTKKLFNIIKKEGYCDRLCSRYSNKPTAKERSAMRQLQRILNKLEKTKLIGKEKGGKCFTWNSTSFGKSIFGQRNMGNTSIKKAMKK